MVDRRNCQVLLLPALIIVVIEKVSIVFPLFRCVTADREGISKRHQAAGNHKDSDSSVSSYLYIIIFLLSIRLY